MSENNEFFNFPKHLFYLPIDIPVMPELNLDHLKNSDYSYWELVKLTEFEENKDNFYKPHSLLPDFSKNNPEFLKWLKFLPCKHIINFKIHRQVSSKLGGAGDHIDLLVPNRDLDHYRNLFFNEPSGYRVVIKGELENKLYIIDRDGNKVYTKLPKDTNTYVINYTACVHGVDEDIGREIGFFQFEIDTVKHRELIERSLRKYREYSVYV